MVRIINFVKGYVRIKVWGVSVERFINLCANKQLLIWGIQRQGEIYEMYISLQAFYELRPIARKTSTRVVILKRYGLPFLLHDYRKRTVFCACSVLVFVFLYASSLFLWDIEYVGNYRLTDQVIEEFLYQQGVYIGMYTGKLDIEMLEKEIRKEFKEVTWTSLKLEGARLKVALKENDAPIIESKEEVEIGIGYDLITPYDGCVVSMIVRSGTPAVSIGEVVEKGRILVEGRVPVYNEDQTVREYLYVEADADIMLEHTISYEEVLDFTYTEKQYTGRSENAFFVRFDQREVKLAAPNPYRDYDVVTKIFQPKLFHKLQIPLSAGVIESREYFYLEKKYTKDEAVSELNKKMNQFIGILQEKGVQIIEKDVKISFNKDSWIVSGNIIVLEPIHTKQSIIQENITDSGE